MKLYRVLYFSESAAPAEPGGVLYIPPQGSNRIDNPGAYRVLYIGDSPSGVCAEVFYRGRYRMNWSASMLRPLKNGHRRVLAWYEVPDATPLCDLDDPKELLRRGLRPSHVITRDYSVTQAWALRIYERGGVTGVKWWSYCDARWAVVGLWNQSIITDSGIEELALDHPAIAGAARIVNVRIR